MDLTNLTPTTPEQDAETDATVGSLDEHERKEALRALLMEKLQARRDRSEMYQQMGSESE